MKPNLAWMVHGKRRLRDSQGSNPCGPKFKIDCNGRISLENAIVFGIKQHCYTEIQFYSNKWPSVLGDQNLIFGTLGNNSINLLYQVRALLVSLMRVLHKNCIRLCNLQHKNYCGGFQISYERTCLILEWIFVASHQ